jgi:hypothetical protein
MMKLHLPILRFERFVLNVVSWREVLVSELRREIGDPCTQKFFPRGKYDHLRTFGFWLLFLYSVHKYIISRWASVNGNRPSRLEILSSRIIEFEDLCALMRAGAELQ